MKKLSFLLAILIFSAFAAFAADSAVPENLKTAFNSKNTQAVSTILETAPDGSAKEYEEFILAEARNAVAKDDLDYGFALAEIVLMFDMDNKAAQRLYTSIDKSRKTKIEAQNRKEAEEKKKAEEAEKKRQMDEYMALKEKENQEKEDYLDAVSNITVQNFPIKLGLTPVALDFANSAFASDYSSDGGFCGRYGLGGNADFGFLHPYVNLNLKLNYLYYPVAFAGDGTKNDFRLRFTVAAPAFTKWIALSVGYNNYSINSEKDVALFTSIASPTIGIGVQNIKYKNFNAETYVDLGLVMFDDQNQVDFNCGIDMYFRYILPVNVSKKFKLYAENNTKVDMIRASNQAEWSIDTAFSVGVVLNAGK